MLYFRTSQYTQIEKPVNKGMLPLDNTSLNQCTLTFRNVQHILSISKLGIYVYFLKQLFLIIDTNIYD